jgi:hypothetical protein
MATPSAEFREPKQPDVCSAIRERRLMTRMFVETLRGHFDSEGDIDNPYLRQNDFLWRGPYDGTDNWRPTGLVIEDLAVWRPRQTLATPAVLVRGNAWQRQKLVIGDGGGDLRLSSWVGSHTLFCIAPGEGLADYFAFEVALYFAGFAQEIRKNFSLLRFGVTEVGATGMLQEPADTYAVPVTVGYGLTDNWFVRQYAPRIAEILTYPDGKR